MDRSIFMRSRRGLAVLAATTLLTACAGLHVDRAPVLEEAATGQWSGYLKASPIGIGKAPQPLWQTLREPVLHDLINDALSANIDVAITASRIRGARASLVSQTAAQGPSLGVNGSASAKRQSENGIIPAGRIPGIETEFTLFDATFDASWEVDLFGRKSARREIAKATLQGQEELLRDVQTSLVADLCRTYVQLRAAQAEKQQLGRIVDVLQKLRSAIKLKRQHGEVSDLDIGRADATLSDYQSRLPALEKDIRSAIYRLSVLTAREPDALTERLIVAAPLPIPAAEITADISSDILRRRADVRKAEHDYIIAARSRDLTALEIYPTFSLFGSAGPNAKSLLDLFDPASIAANLGALVSWPLFDGGRRRADIDAADEKRVQAELGYRKAVLEALEDVESAALRYVEAGYERDQSDHASAARARILQLERVRFSGGTGTKIEILLAERDLAEAELAVSKRTAEVLIERIALEKALGVGVYDISMFQS
jgi:NodT family efflux transporter outer membrane factor (OMF) lipoprotein